MGCATSSPLVTVNDGILKAAKGAADNVAHAGEETVHEMTGALNTAVGSVKEAVVGAVSNVGHGIENAFNGKSETEKNTIANSMTSTEAEQGFKIIPLKDPNKALDEIAETVDEKSKECQNEAEKLATEVKRAVDEAMPAVPANRIDDISPVHSLDSLKTSTPDSEIENALANKLSTSPPTPKPTFSELEPLELLKKEVATPTEPEPKKDVQKILVESTDWEKMADLLGRPHRQNTVDALRRILNRRHERRVASSSVRGRYDYNSAPYPILQSPPIRERSFINSPKSVSSHSPSRSPASVRTRSPSNILRAPSPKNVSGRVSHHRSSPQSVSGRLSHASADHNRNFPSNNSISGLSESPSKSPYRKSCAVCSGEYKGDNKSVHSISFKRIK